MKLLKESTVLYLTLRLLVELDKSRMVYQLSMINQTLCIVWVLGNSYYGWPLLEV